MIIEKGSKTHLNHLNHHITDNLCSRCGINTSHTLLDQIFAFETRHSDTKQCGKLVFNSLIHSFVRSLVVSGKFAVERTVFACTWLMGGAEECL